MSKIFWLTGISGAGKTTIATCISEYLQNRGIEHHVLDGDEVRAFFDGDLGFQREERIANVKRIAFAAHVLSRHGITVVVANIAPYYEVRDFIRAKLGESYRQIYVKASLATVQKRDVKGFYRKLAAGEMKNLVGADDAYDPPRSPDLVLDTDAETPDESRRKILDFINEAL